MARRKKFRIPADLPGLWDTIDEEVVLKPSAPAPKATNEEPMPDTEPLQPKRREELLFMSFGSGSSGNCSYIGLRNKGGIIIDAGVDANKVIDELHRNGINPNRISGILLTHDHSDHVRFVHALVRKLPAARIFCTPRTLNGLLRRHSISRRIKDYHQQIFKEFEFDAGPFKVTPFDVSHDGSDNVGFSICAGDGAFVVATDMGVIGERADFYIRKANWLMIETNYDSRMLAQGSYPEYLKARIRSERGHLDNAVTAAYLADIWTEKLTDIYLCHLSNDNNRPEIAFACVSDTLSARGIQIHDPALSSSPTTTSSVRLSILPRYDSSPLFIHRL